MLLDKLANTREHIEALRKMGAVVRGASSLRRD